MTTLRQTSPHLRSPSPNPPPRQSTSSNRSFRRTEADFEAALLNPASTIFLSGSPTFEDDSGDLTNGDGNGGSRFSEFDGDAPVPVEKRSFEEDLDMRTISSRKGTGGGGGKMLVPGVIPPTPTLVEPVGVPIERRPSRGPSLGNDAELNEVSPSKMSVQKRRSMFRGPGTASSPDLATLVRKAKEAKSNGTATSTETNQNTALANPLPVSATTAAPASTVTASSSTPIRPGVGRDRSISQILSRDSSDSWDQFSNGDLSSVTSGSGEKMAMISEGRRSRQSSGETEGFKSMRSKAKGVLGRMFGSTNSRDPAPSQGISSSTIMHSRQPSSPRPPVPPVPANYAAEAFLPRRRAPEPPSGVKDSPNHVSESPRKRHVDGTTTPIAEGRVSTTPTGRRQLSGGSIANLDKALPIIHTDAGPFSSPMNTIKRATMHSRQPATDALMDDEIEASSSSSGPSPPRKPIPSFSEDVSDMLDNIGQTDPARELGLAPDSVRRIDWSLSIDENVRRKPPPELARSNSTNPPPRSPGNQHRPSLSPVPAVRKSSLHPSSPKPQHSPRPVPPCIASSPQPSTYNLLAEPASISRSSSTSSRRRHATENGHTYAALGAAPLGSPLVVIQTMSDFGPIRVEEGDDTIRAKPKSDPSSPLLPTSVRLVSASPRLEPALLPLHITSNGLAKSSFIDTSPWGKQSPRIVSDDQEILGTPIGEDEEKGRKLACEFLENDFTSVPADKVAEFLGGSRLVNSKALRYYMQYFDMKNQGLVDAFRDLCQKLHLKAESQEIDRIIEGFSARYYQCNPNSVYGSPGVIHTVTGAMLMLNTDLHIADLSKHMSRSDFIRNAMRAIQESMPADRESTPELIRDDSSSVHQQGVGSSSSSSVRAKVPINPINAPRSASAPVMAARSTSTGSYTSKAWELEAEASLKDIYASVRADRTLLPIGGPQNGSNNRYSMMSVSSAGTSTRNGRSPSGKDVRVNALKRGSIRVGNGSHPYSANSNGSDGRLSPTGSYANSINEPYSLSASIGFASNLTHTVIREHEVDEDEVRSMVSHNSLSSLGDEMNDDELALLGAPWAKEGILLRNLIPGPVVKKVKSTKDWKQYFGVVQKGTMHLFTFGDTKGGSYTGGQVGGGNWLNNANAIGSWDLMHTFAQSVPESRSSKPNLFSIHLGSGEVNTFQAGTIDLVQEWLQTCNYWAARRSRQPLQGGVGNIEYGWTRAANGGGAIEDLEDRASIKSGRSNLSKLGGSSGGSSYGRRGYAGSGIMDKVHINDWRPPANAVMPSPLEEEAQLESLSGWIRSLREDLEGHKGVEEAMNRMYSSGSKNHLKARQNWTTKLQYLQAEINKYTIYTTALRSAIALRVKKQGERRLEKSLARSMTSLHRRESEGSILEEGEEREVVGYYEPTEKKKKGVGLRIDSSRRILDDEEGELRTPVAHQTRI